MINSEFNAPGAIMVMGAGAWGTALAQTLARAGRAPTLWSHSIEIVEEISVSRENDAYLPGVRLADSIQPIADIAACAHARMLFAACPAQPMRSVLRAAAAHLPAESVIVLCAKGIEQETLALMSEVAAAELPGRPIAVLSGPGFAADVAHGLPTATTIAADAPGIARLVADCIATLTFRPYLSDDVVGAEIGGAVKNVIAIACGVARGLMLGDGAHAALLTRGFAEMARLAQAKGARLETLTGLSGLGDLVLTCGSLNSRNTSLGMAMAQGRKAAEIIAERRSVAEGAATAPALLALAARHQVEMPIAAAIAALLSGETDAAGAMQALLARPLRAEAD